MTKRLPHAVRALLAFDRAVQWMAKGEVLLRDELIFALTPPSRRDALNDALYAKHAGYGRGGAIFATGLQSWERALLARRPFPDGGKILIGGAGGGREVAALEALGFRTVAFEPNEALFVSLQDVSGNAHRGSYDDLERAVERNEGPLAALVREAPFDGMIFGWASLAHVIDEDARIRALRAARSLCEGPVVLSFIARAVASAREARVASGLRRLLGGDARPGERFFPGGGFARSIDLPELSRIAAAARYRVDVFEVDPIAHALLRPMDVEPR